MRAVRVPSTTLVELTAGLAKADRDEMAVPSYTHGIPLVSWLYWSRLDSALSLARLRPGERVLDFASGTGVLLPSLARERCRVAATDLHLGPSMEHARRIRFDIEEVPLPRFDVWAEANAGRFDCIFALDVLEHVTDDEMERLRNRFAELLSEDGRLIISGGTETRAYRVARWLAGFRAPYHHRSIFDAERSLAARWRFERRVILPPWPLPGGFLVARYVPRP